MSHDAMRDIFDQMATWHGKYLDDKEMHPKDVEKWSLLSESLPKKAWWVALGLLAAKTNVQKAFLDAPQKTSFGAEGWNVKGGGLKVFTVFSKECRTLSLWRTKQTTPICQKSTRLTALLLHGLEIFSPEALIPKKS